MGYGSYVLDTPDLNSSTRKRPYGSLRSGSRASLQVTAGSSYFYMNACDSFVPYLISKLVSHLHGCIGGTLLPVSFGNHSATYLCYRFSPCKVSYGYQGIIERRIYMS